MHCTVQPWYYFKIHLVLTKILWLMVMVHWALIKGLLDINKILLGPSQHLRLSFQVLSIFGKDTEPPYRCGADNGTRCFGT